MKNLKLKLPILLINGLIVYILIATLQPILSSMFKNGLDVYSGTFLAIGVIILFIFSIYAYFLYLFFENKSANLYWYLFFLILLSAPTLLVIAFAQ